MEYDLAYFLLFLHKPHTVKRIVIDIYDFVNDCLLSDFAYIKEVNHNASIFEIGGFFFNFKTFLLKIPYSLAVQKSVCQPRANDLKFHFC